MKSIFTDEGREERWRYLDQVRQPATNEEVTAQYRRHMKTLGINFPKSLPEDAKKISSNVTYCTKLLDRSGEEVFVKTFPPVLAPDDPEKDISIAARGIFRDIRTTKVLRGIDIFVTAFQVPVWAKAKDSSNMQQRWEQCPLVACCSNLV